MSAPKSNFVLILLGIFVATPSLVHSQDDVSHESQHRRPVAVCLDQTESIIAIANRESGTVSIIKRDEEKVTGEYKVAKECGDLINIESENVFVVSDSEAGFIRGFSIDNDAVKVLWQLETGSNPVAMQVGPEEERLAVSGKWSRRLMLLQKSNSGWNETPTIKHTVELPFNAGPVCWLSKSRLIVADAFGSGVALIDFNKNEPKVIATEIEGHRTGGLSLSADRQWVAFTDQRLNPLARSTRNDVHWGLMISNQLRWLEVKKLLTITSTDEFSKQVNDFVSHPVGRPGDAKADLGDVAVTRSGVVAFTVGGVNELAIGKRDENNFAFVSVGCRPSAVTCSNDSEFGFVTNMLDDSISVVDLDDFKVVSTISLGKHPELDEVGKGERLFFDASLSHDNWMSCHSCHIDGHTNGALNDNLSDDSFHSPKLVISLLGHDNTSPLTWNGTHADLKTQMRRSIESTMQSDRLANEEQVAQLAAFTRSLTAPPAVSISRKTLDEERRKRGEKLFTVLECNRCHSPPTFTSPELFDVGVRDEDGKTRFNPPSLIGLGQRKRLFHDARFSSVEEVLVAGEHQLPRPLAAEELSDLAEFLKSL